MAKSVPANQRHAARRVSGELIARLNALDPGLGTLFATDVNASRQTTAAALKAAAGQHGTVVIAEQKRSSGNRRPAAISVSQGQIADVARATEGHHAVPLEQVRAMFTCDHFGGHPSGFPGWFEECVDTRGGTTAATPGIVHAMWGYSYEIPGFNDVDPGGDPGILELFGGLGSYWQMIVPVTTVFDRVTWWNDDHDAIIGPDLIRFGFYDMNQQDSEFERLAQTEAITLSTAPIGVNTTMLDSRLIIDPGIYATALCMPCHHIASQGANQTGFQMVNSLWPIPRYGNFHTSGEMPEVLDASNIVPNGDVHDINIVGEVPMTYWDDSLTFTAAESVS